jgi:hypothetical protein
MSKIARNAPCPCGSGQKYKKCCASKEAADASQHDRAQVPAVPASAAWQVIGDDPLDVLSNSVIGLIKKTQFDEALAVCERLRVEYPEVPDWLERSAMVHEARGDAALAVDFYRRMLAFTELPEQRDGYDEEIRQLYRQKLAALGRSIANHQA